MEKKIILPALLFVLSINLFYAETVWSETSTKITVGEEETKYISGFDWSHIIISSIIIILIIIFYFLLTKWIKKYIRSKKSKKFLKKSINKKSKR